MQTLKHTQNETIEAQGLPGQPETNAAQDRDEAIEALYHNIWHQDRVDMVSAVRLLIARLQSDVIQGKDELLLLLAYIARGNSYADVQHHDTDEQDTSESKEQLPQELECVGGARDAIGEGVEVYLDLLAHDEPMIRTCAAYILGCFREYAYQIIPTLRSCIAKEEDELAKSSMLLSLGALAESAGFLGTAAHRGGDSCGTLSGEVVCSHISLSLLGDGEATAYQKLLTEIIKEQASPLIKLAASIALARLAKDDTPPEAIRVLVNTLVEPESTQDVYVELPWADSDVIGDISAVLYALGPRATGIAIPMLIEAFRTAGSHSSLRIVDALLHLAFNGEPINTDITAQTLTDEQRLVLTTIANSNSAWVINIINMGSVPMGSPPKLHITSSSLS